MWSSAFSAAFMIPCLHVRFGYHRADHAFLVVQGRSGRFAHFFLHFFSHNAFKFLLHVSMDRFIRVHPLASEQSCCYGSPSGLLSTVDLCQESLLEIGDRQRTLWLDRKGFDRIWDVTLCFEDGQRLLCSRKDLCVMSDYFSTIFRSGFNESENKKEVPLAGVCESIMERMVESYYLGQVS